MEKGIFFFENGGISLLQATSKDPFTSEQGNVPLTDYQF